MNKTVVWTLVGALAFSPMLASCGKQNAQPAETPAASSAEGSSAAAGSSQASTPTTLTGGWTVNTEATSTLTDEEAAIFSSATEGLVGVGYEPVAVLATQLVSGTNYAFLAKGTTVTAEPVNDWYIVVVYANLEGKNEVTSINAIDLTSIKTLENSNDTTGMTGAWAIKTIGAAALPADAQKAFDTALQSHTGVNLHPIALLGSQLVAGTNYYVLCSGEPVVADPQPELYVVEVFADLEGGAEFSEVKVFDLLGYVG